MNIQCNTIPMKVLLLKTKRQIEFTAKSSLIQFTVDAQRKVQIREIARLNFS